MPETEGDETAAGANVGLSDSPPNQAVLALQLSQRAHLALHDLAAGASLRGGPADSVSL